MAFYWLGAIAAIICAIFVSGIVRGGMKSTATSPPRSNDMTINVGLTVSIDRAFAGGGGGLSAPTLNYPSPLAANPTTIGVHIPVDWQAGDTLNLARSASLNMTSPTVLTHTVAAADITAGTFSIGLSGVTLSGITYFDAYGTHNGVQSPNVSNIVTWGDTTAPTITTSATQSVFELLPLSVALTGTDAGGIASWAITGGADQTQFAISGSTLTWYNNGTQTYGSPGGSAAGTNAYVVQVTATDYGGNASNLSITVTVNQAVKTPSNAQPWFTNVVPSTPSTVYTSNTITIAGLTPGISVTVSLTGSPGTYSKNGGAFTAANGTAQNGDTFALRTTSGPGATDVQNVTLNVGSGSSTWTVSNTAITTQFATGSPNKSANIILSNGNLTATSNDGTQNAMVRTNQPNQNTKFQIEFTLGGSLGEIVVGIEDGTDPFNPNPTSSGIPGFSDAHGVTLDVVGTGWTMLFSGAGPSSFAGGAGGLSGDIYGLLVDLTPASGSRTITAYRVRSGVTSTLGSISTLSFTSVNAFVGTKAGSSTIPPITMNAGQSAFANTVAGYVAFGHV